MRDNMDFVIAVGAIIIVILGLVAYLQWAIV